VRDRIPIQVRWHRDGGYFEDAGTEFHVGVVIGNDGDEAVAGEKGDDGFLANEVGVAWVRGVDADGGAAYDGFGTCGHITNLNLK